MTVRKKIPAGIEDFKELIDKKYFFIDKTLLIKDLIETGDKVSLVTRPRRFGKTLNMSMIQRFFEKTDEDNTYLFDGLKISSEGEEYLQYQGKYPVITLSLKSMKQPTYEMSLYQFKQMLAEEYDRHSELLKSEFLNESDKAEYSSLLFKKADEKDYLASIRLLSRCLKKHYNQNTIILIDEYDVPLENAYFCGFYEQMVSFIRSLFESALKTNPALEFAILTGCLRISKESIFTGLNNFNVYSVTENALSDYYGFTQDEVEFIAENYNMTDRLSEMKRWYDGYIFGKTEIYNPWSIIKYVSSVIKENKISCKPYWINTSSNSIIHDLVSKSDENTRNKIETLITGGSVKAFINENTVYADIDVNADSIWSFLLFTGYLKQIKTEFKDRRIYSEMIIPNLEVLMAYEDIISSWFRDTVKREGTETLFNAMLNENPEVMETELCKWLKKSISFYDTKENFYHGFLAGLLSGYDGYELKSNRENGDGRSDITVCEYSQRKIAVVIEVKVAESYSQLETMCNKALDQIRDQKYAEQMKEDCYKKVISYGIAFSEKSCMVKLGE